MGRGVGGASSVWTTAWHGLKRHGKVEFCSHCLRWVRWLFLNLFWVLPSRPVAGCFFRVLPSLSVAGCDLFVIFTSGSYRPGWPCHLLGRSLQCFMSPTDKSLEPGMVWNGRMLGCHSFVQTLHVIPQDLLGWNKRVLKSLHQKLQDDPACLYRAGHLA